MNNEELKKKICDIIVPYVSAYGDDERIADALIAAGIGDVKEVEKGYRDAIFLAVKSQTMTSERSRYIELNKNIAEHRAEVAERAIDLILTREKDLRCIHSFTNCDKNCELCWEGYFSKQKQGYLEQAEKELAEERKE